MKLAAVACIALAKLMLAALLVSAALAYLVMCAGQALDQRERT